MKQHRPPLTLERRIKEALKRADPRTQKRARHIQKQAENAHNRGEYEGKRQELLELLGLEPAVPKTS